MQTHNRATIEELQWKDVRNEVAKKNPELAKIIDDISPGAEYTLFKASYPFGSEIMKGGKLHIPNAKGKLVPLSSHEISPKMQSQLSYNLDSNPVTFVLKNTTEIFIVHENNTIPLYGWITPGRVFGTWRVLNSNSCQHPIFIWDMTAGMRSMFMLPKISETTGYNRLRRAFHLHAEKPVL